MEFKVHIKVGSKRLGLQFLRVTECSDFCEITAITNLMNHLIKRLDKLIYECMFRFETEKEIYLSLIKF